MNRDEMTEALHIIVWSHPAAGMSMDDAREVVEHVLGPLDSPLVWHTVTDTGDVIDVRAALVALSRPLRLEATDDQFVPWGGTMEQTMRKVLASKGITGPLADVILRLAREAS